jgi:hypothetical protein
MILNIFIQLIHPTRIKMSLWLLSPVISSPEHTIRVLFGTNRLNITSTAVRLIKFFSSYFRVRASIKISGMTSSVGHVYSPISISVGIYKFSVNNKIAGGIDSNLNESS